MRPADLEDLYELAPLQRGILFHCLSGQDSGLYRITLCYGLRGPLDTELFLRAWHTVVGRHPVLRTSFHWTDLEKPLQLVHRDVRLPCDILDWSHLAAEEQEERLAGLLEAEQRREMPLDRAPLMHLDLIRTGAETHKLVWVFHHILMEGWSASLVLHEAFALYEGWRSGVPVELAPRRPYRDHILWLQDRDPGHAQRFWRRALEGFSAPTPLPLARDPRGRQPAGYGRRSLALSPAASTALLSLARRHHLTPGTLLQGAWALLLARLADEEDVAFGCVVSGRQEGLPEAESMVGLFVNTLPARVAVRPSAVVIPWLESLQQQLAEMRELEWSPLPEVQAWSPVPRGTPIFRTIFAFENWVGDIALRKGRGELVVEDVRAVEGGIGYPLLVEAGAGRQVSVSLTYDQRHYDDEGAGRLLGHYGRLLEGIAACPHATLAELPLLEEEERSRLLTSWNETARGRPREATLTQLVARQVRDTPHAVAVEDRTESLTYAELGRRSSQLAHHLRELGVGPETRVGILCERSVDLAVALLGILRAGGAWVPLDPSHPEERLALVLGDSGAEVVVTQEHLLGRLPASPARTLCLERSGAAASPEGSEPPAVDSHVESLAYLIYTSGSTGRPKGVQIPHRAVVNLLWAMRHTPGLDREDVFLSVTSTSFDIFVVELFLPLIVGARVVLASREVASDGEALAREVTRSGATVMQSTPATWRMLLEAGWSGAPGMKILCGGEAMPSALARELRSRCGQVWNLYGPTETTVYSTGHRVDVVEEGGVPIGRPMANTRVYVVDRGGQLAPEGVVGELWIGGEGVARGYLGRADLTALSFCPDPWARRPGARLYRTGDRVRWCRDGRLEFLGRLDDQVKVRGFRIEPGEVEAALGRHPNVREAAVVAREDPNGERRLVAYTSPRDGQVPPDELRAFLASRLPDYMVPSVYVTLPDLPRTSSRKVDRRALPEPGEDRPELSQDFLAPRTPAEERVAAVWRDVLGLERVGVRDSFFDLGGDSLLLVRLHTRLRKSFPERELAVVDLFRHATVENIARHLNGEGSATPTPPEETEGLADRVRAGRARLGRRREARRAPGVETGGGS